MKLNTAERVQLLMILPKEEGVTTLRIVNELKAKIAFTEEELKDLNLVEADGKITWDAPKGLEEKEIEIGEKATDIIVAALKKLDEEKKVTNDLLSLFDKFVK